MTHTEHEHRRLSQDDQVNALLGKLGRMVHEQKLTEDGLIALGPQLGMPDGSDFDYIHNQLRSPEGIKTLEEHYAKLDDNARRAIDSAIDGYETQQTGE